MSCDDECQLDLALDSDDPATVTTVNDITYHTSHRNYIIDAIKGRSGVRSEWYALEEGKPYYIEGRMSEGGGGDHYSVAVEVESDMAGH
jgi:hypothetical protein